MGPIQAVLDPSGGPLGTVWGLADAVRMTRGVAAGSRSRIDDGVRERTREASLSSVVSGRRSQDESACRRQGTSSSSSPVVVGGGGGGGRGDKEKEQRGRRQ